MTCLVATITSSLVNETPSLLAERLDLLVDGVVQEWVNRLKFVSASMAMIISQEAALAEVEVGTVLASHEC